MTTALDPLYSDSVLLRSRPASPRQGAAPRSRMRGATLRFRADFQRWASIAAQPRQSSWWRVRHGSMAESFLSLQHRRLARTHPSAETARLTSSAGHVVPRIWRSRQGKISSLAYGPTATPLSSFRWWLDTTRTARRRIWDGEARRRDGHRASGAHYVGCRSRQGCRGRVQSHLSTGIRGSFRLNPDGSRDKLRSAAMVFGDHLRGEPGLLRLRSTRRRFLRSRGFRGPRPTDMTHLHYGANSPPRADPTLDGDGIAIARGRDVATVATWPSTATRRATIGRDHRRGP